MPRPLRIDFVSDVVCPWCVIGLKSLEAALARTTELFTPEFHFHPFELNPEMPSEGENTAEHVARKYGASPEQAAASRSTIRQMGADLGFTFTAGPDMRIWNTFDCHRLLHWAGRAGRQQALKEALFTAYFTRGEALANRQVLIAAAAAAGLDRDAAGDVLDSGHYADDVRAEAAFWRDRGITAVPAIVFDGRYAVLGGQPVDTFERFLRKLDKA